MLAHKLRSAAVKPTSGDGILIDYATLLYNETANFNVLTGDVIVGFTSSPYGETEAQLTNLTQVSRNTAVPVGCRFYVLEATSDTTISSSITIGSVNSVAMLGLFRGFTNTGRINTAWRNWTGDATMRYNQITGVDVGWLIVACGSVGVGQNIVDEPSSGYTPVTDEFPTGTSTPHVFLEYKIAEATTELPGILTISSIGSRTIVAGFPSA